MQTHPARKPFVALFLALAVAWLGGGCTPSGPRALLQGAALIRKGKYEAAITKLKIATDLIRNDARAWNYLGLAYHGAGQYGEAIIAYQRAQQLDQNLAEARYNLGELYLEQGNPVSASDEFSIFTALRPKSVDGWLRLGDANLQNQRYDRAQTSYYIAINLKRETPEAFNGLGLILLQRKDPRDAYKYFVEATKYDADYAPAILNMAVVADSYLNALPTALTKYREYLAKAPDASNAAAVKAAVRRLDTIVNPKPPPREEPKAIIAENETPPETETSAQSAQQVAARESSKPRGTEKGPSVTSALTNQHTPPKQQNVVKERSATKPNATSEVKVSTTKPGERPVAEKTVGASVVKTNETKIANPQKVAMQPPEKTSPVTNAPPQIATQTPPPATHTPPVQLAKNDVKSGTNLPAKAAPDKASEEIGQETKVAVKTEPPPTGNVVTNTASGVADEKVAVKTPEKAKEEPPLEEVKLAEVSLPPPTEIKTPEEDIPAAKTETEPTQEAVTKAEPTPATVKPAPQNAEALPRVDNKPTEEKHGFFQRINPVNLFRSSKPEEPAKRSDEIVTPLPPEDSPTESVASQATQSQTSEKPRLGAKAEPSAVTPMPPSVSFPRYQYGKIKKPTAGDRSAAERLFSRGVDAQNRRDPAGAATFFAAAAAADSTYYAAHYNLGLVAYSEGQLFKALSAFETALVLDPHSVDARYNFALSLQKAGFPLDAAHELETLLAEKPDDTRSRLLLGNVYAQDLKNTPAAREQYGKVLELAPQHPQATAIRYWLVQHPVE